MKSPDQTGSYQNTPPPYAPSPVGAGYPPPAGTAGYPPAGYAVPQGQQTVIIQAGGNCPNCQVGFLVENYSLCGILWLILCFPFGLICFLSMKDKKCGRCGYEVRS